MSQLKRYIVLFIAIFQIATLVGCNDYSIYQLKQDDISLSASELTVVQYEIINIVVTSVSDEGVSYLWSIDKEIISSSKNLFHTFLSQGSFTLVLTAIQEDLGVNYQYEVHIEVSESQYNLEEDNVVI